MAVIMIENGRISASQLGNQWIVTGLLLTFFGWKNKRIFAIINNEKKFSKS
jgi:hypothetical protein